MVIDTSALLAILLNEPEAPQLVKAIMGAERAVVGTPSLVEAAAVMLAKKGPGGEVALDALLERLGIDSDPFTEDGARLAVSRTRASVRASAHPGCSTTGTASLTAWRWHRGSPCSSRATTSAKRTSPGPNTTQPETPRLFLCPHIGFQDRINAGLVPLLTAGLKMV